MSWEILEPRTPQPLSEVRVSCFVPARGNEHAIGITMPEDVMNMINVKPTGTVRILVGRDEHAGQLYIQQGADWPIHRIAKSTRGRLMLPAPNEYTSKFPPVAVSLIYVESRQAFQILLPTPEGKPRDLPIEIDVSNQDAASPVEDDQDQTPVDEATEIVKSEEGSEFPRNANAKALKIPLEIYNSMSGYPRVIFDVLKWQEPATALELAMAGVPVLPLAEIEVVLEQMMDIVADCGLVLESDKTTWWLRRETQEETAAPIAVEDENDADGPALDDISVAATVHTALEMPDKAYKKMKPILRRFFDELSSGQTIPIEKLQKLTENGEEMSVMRCIHFVTTLRKIIDKHDLIIEKDGEAYTMKCWQAAVAENA